MRTTSVGETGASALRVGRAGERRLRVLRLALASAIVLGTFAGVVGTSTLALVLTAPRLLTSGLEPRPESAVLGWLVSTEVSSTATTVLLWLLGAATLGLAAAVAIGARRLWLAFAAWAIVGGTLTAYALAANWQLAPEAGVLAFGIGGIWSALVALAIARLPGRHAARAG
ncbi:MAG TPA: hypothetical protein VFZ11_13545 [Gemmatimonadaceae bacterium]